MIKRVAVLSSPAALATLVLAGCVGGRAPAPPAPPPQARPVPAPRAVPTAPTPTPPGFADLPRTPGAWDYSPGPAGSNAGFTSGGRRAFIVGCSRLSNSIYFERDGIVRGATTMTVRTSYGSRNLAASGPTVRPAPLPTAPGTVPAPPVPQAVEIAAVIATLRPSDPLLDQMIFSRGHYAIEVSGVPRIVIPTWPEFARVVEDCRK